MFNIKITDLSVFADLFSEASPVLSTSTSLQSVVCLCCLNDFFFEKEQNKKEKGAGVKGGPCFLRQCKRRSAKIYMVTSRTDLPFT